MFGPLTDNTVRKQEINVSLCVIDSAHRITWQIPPLCIAIQYTGAPVLQPWGVALRNLLQMPSSFWRVMSPSLWCWVE